MKSSLLIISSCLALLGCHRHEGEDHHEGSEHEEHASEGGHGHSHGADAKSFSGATHKEGKGITLLPETKERLNLELTEVQDQKLPLEISFAARVFASKPNGEFEASGILSTEKIPYLRKGSPVKIQLQGGKIVPGVVSRTSTPISTNETEVIVHFASSDPAITHGSFLKVHATAESDEAVTTVPKEALIKGTTESFVYVQNEDAYLRTVVTPGRESADKVEIKEGLFEGDFVVSKAAMDLWLVELRAVKGGQGCCPAPPVKAKGK